MKRIFVFLFSGETMFAAFLIGGIFKSLITSIPVDLSIVFMALSIFIAGKRLFHSPRIEKYSFVPITLFVAIAALILASMLYTPGFDYALTKTVRFVVLTGWSFVGAFFLIKDKASLVRFLKGIIFLSLITSAYGLYQYYTIFGLNAVFVRYDGADGNNSLGLARCTGFAIIALILLYIYEKTRASKKLFALVCIAILVIAMLFTGSKMPLLALLVSIITLLFFSVRSGNTKRIFPLLFALLLIPFLLFPLFSKGTFDTIIFRLNVLFNAQGGDQARTDRFNVAVDMWENHPVFGEGIGSFPLTYENMDIRSYPHNIFLEFLAELGIAGSSLLVVLILLSALRVIVHLRKNKWKINAAQISVIITAIYLFMNVNVTGDMNDNRLFFTLLAIISMIHVFDGETIPTPTHKLRLQSRSLRLRYLYC